MLKSILQNFFLKFETEGQEFAKKCEITRIIYSNPFGNKNFTKVGREGGNYFILILFYIEKQ